MTSYNYNAPADKDQTTSTAQSGERLGHLCGCARGAAIVHCLHNGCCCLHEEPENSQHQSDTEMDPEPTCVDDSQIVPSTNVISDPSAHDIDVEASDVTISADVSNRSSSSRSSDTLVDHTGSVTKNDDHGADQDVTDSEETTGNLMRCEVNTPTAGLTESETLIVEVDVISNEDVSPPGLDIHVTNNDTAALGSPND